MASDWQIFPPWTPEQGPTNISLGSPVRSDFEIVNQNTPFENMTNLEWTGLSRQEVANLRNMINSQELKQWLLLSNYGLSWGANVAMEPAEDTNDAEFGFSIHSKMAITETSLQEIMSLIRSYKVH